MTGTGTNAASPTTLGSLEGIALELIGQLTEIRSRDHWRRWRPAHGNVLAALYRLLPDCPVKRRLTALGRAKKARYGQPAPVSRKHTRSRSRREASGKPTRRPLRQLEGVSG